MPSAVRRRLTLLIAVTAFCGCLPAVARAGTYDVVACNAAPEGAVTSWNLVRTDTTIATTSNCPTGGNPDAGLGLYTVPDNNLLSSPGQYASWQFNALGGTTIDGVTADYEIVRRDQHAWWGGWGVGSTLIQGCLVNSAVLDCTLGTTPGNSAWINTVGATNVNVVIGCSQVSDPWQCTHGWAHGLFGSQMAVIVRSAAVRVNDASAPSLTVSAGGLAGGGGVLTGTQPITYSANDNVGIKGVSFAIDGVERGWALSACDYAQRVPCPNVTNASQSFDTSGLSDGPHVLTVTATDTANNLKTAPASTFTVDNAAPAAPINLQVDEGELWRGSPSYSVHWTNPSGQVSPIARAYYRLCRASDPSACEDVQSQANIGISSLSGVRVPNEGDWVLRVYLEDQAGNVRPANASSPVHLRYDASTPQTPSGVAVEGGEGWRKDNRFDVHWTNPSGELAPISVAHYELCDAQQHCQGGTGDGGSLSGLSVPGRGEYALSIWLEDEAGNADRRNASGPVHLRFDDADPGVAHPGSSRGWLTAHSLDEIVGLDPGATVPLSGIAGYSVTTDGSEPDDTAETGASGVFQIADLDEGRTTVKARAVSGSGVASQQVGSGTVLVDRSAPEARVTGAPDPDAWQPSAVTLTVVGEDQAELSGMDGGRIVYSVDDGDESNVPGGSAVVPVSGDGVHELRYRAVDAAANESVTRRTTFKIDATPPARVELWDPSRWLNADDVAHYVEHLSPPALPLSGLAGYSVTTDGSDPDAQVDTQGDLNLSDLADGVTTVRARAVSGSGLASNEVGSVTLRVDGSAPEVEVAGAPDSDEWQSSAVHLRLRASDQPGLSGITGGRVAYSVDRSDAVVVDGDAADLTVATNGEHSVSYFAVDAAGNRSVERVVKFRVDSDAPGRAEPAAPDGWISAPTGHYAERIRLAAGATPSPSGIAGYSVTVDGSDPDATPDTDASGNFDVDSLEEGVTVIKARAVSGSGVASPEIGSAELRIDRTAPEASASGSDHPDEWSADRVEVRLRGSDRLSGMSAGHIAYSVDGGESHDVEGDAASVEITEDGRHTIAFKARDAAGNASAEKTVAVLVDRSAPEVTLERPAVDTPDEITARVADAASGVTRGEIEIRGADEWKVLPTTLADGRLVARLDTARLPRRMYEFRATATDAAGNARASIELGDGTKLTLLLGVDPQPPAVTATPAPGPPAVAPAPAKPAVKRCPKRAGGRRRASRRCVARPHRNHQGGEKKRHRHLGHQNHKTTRRHAG